MLAHIAVRDVLHVIKIDAVFGNFNGACFAVESVIRLTHRIVDADAVHQKNVIVKAGHQRRRRAGPCALRIFHQFHDLSADVHFDLLGGGRGQTKLSA